MGDSDKIKKEIDVVLQDVAKTLNFSKYELIPNLNMSYGDGFVSSFYTGQVKDSLTGKIINVAIKMGPPDQTFDVKILFRNEQIFYEKVYPCLDKLQRQHNVENYFNNIPTYFCSNVDSNTYIAMENLKLEQYALYDKLQYLNKEHLEFIFKTYAKFHALSFVLKKRNEELFTELSSEFTDAFLQFKDEWIKEIEGPIEAVVGYLEGDAQIKFKKITDNLKQHFIKSSKYLGTYDCITHGDCWSNNMMFKYTNSGKIEDIKLLDFQLSRCSTPIHDLSYFFYSGGSKTDFDNLNLYLELYHRHFLNYCRALDYELDDLLPLETLKKEWKENALLGVFLAIFLWNIKLLPKEKFQKLLDHNISEEEKTAKWEQLKRELYTSDDFQEKAMNIVRHALEYGII